MNVETLAPNSARHHDASTALQNLAPAPLPAPIPATSLELAHQGISALFNPTDVVELRIPKARNGKGTISGYFVANHPALPETILELSGKHDAIYVTLNPCSPALLARAANRVKTRAQTTTSDHDILKRTKLLIDIDPVRSAGISATDEEIGHARIVTKDVFDYLKSLGWPTPTSAESGNGFHLLYNIDLPNSKDVTELIKAVLKALSEKYDNAKAKVDKSVFNAARIVKAYGSLAAKGDSTADRPHRVARILEVGSGTVTLEQLQALASETVSPAALAPQTNTNPSWNSNDITPEKVEEFLECHGIAHHPVVAVKEGQVKWVLECCPFNPEHQGKDAAVFFTNGVLGFKCLHNSCSENHWKAFRQQVEENSGKKFYFSECNGTATVIVGQSVEPDVAPAWEPEAEATDKMPHSVLDGKLGEVCQKRMKIFPLDFAWPALVACASALVPDAPQPGLIVGGRPQHPRANLYACLIGPVHSGKTTSIEQALYILGLKPGQKNVEYLLELKAGSAEGLASKIGNIAGGSRLLYPDELLHLLDKTAISKSSFQAVLNSAFNKDRDPAVHAKSKQVEFNCRLSIVGGLVAELFETAFGANTVGGLYDRFLFGHHVADKPLLFEYPDETPEDFAPVPVVIDQKVLSVAHEWVMQDGINPRVVEIALRVAHVCASFDGRPVLLPKDLGPAHALAKHQEELRRRFAPNPGNNDVAHCAISIEHLLTKNLGKWMWRSKLYKAIHAERLGPKVFDDTITAMWRNGKIRKHKDGNVELLALNTEIADSQLKQCGTTNDWANFKVTFQSGTEKP